MLLDIPVSTGRSSYPARERVVGLLRTSGHYRFRAVRFVLRHTWPHGTVWVVLGVAVSLRALNAGAAPHPID